MSRLVGVCPYDVNTNVFIADNMLYSRCIKDLFYCCDYEGHPLYIEKFKDDDYIAYIGLSANSTPVRVLDIADALHFEVGAKAVIEPDKWEPLLSPDFDKVCVTIMYRDYALARMRVDDDIREAIAAGRTITSTGKRIREVEYTGKNREEVIDLIIESESMPNLTYKEMNNVRFYFYDVTKDSYKLFIVGGALIGPEHPMFLNWLSILNIKVTESMKRKLEEMRNGKDDVQD